MDHDVEMSDGYRHGTRYAYVFKRCRCEQCRAWNTATAKAYRERRAAREAATSGADLIV